MNKLLGNISNDINNMKDCLSRHWESLVADEAKDIDELYETLKTIEHNLPCKDYYIVGRMWGDRELMSTMMCSTFIEEMLEFDGVEKPSELSKDFLEDAITVIKSGYGSCELRC